MTQKVVFNTSANGEEGGFWEAGCGPGVDTNGDLIAITGNGTFDTKTPRVNYGDSFLRLTPGAGTMSVTSFFTPLNEFLLDDDDLDMGSGGNLLLPDQPGPNTHLMVGAGKVGTLYLVNRDSMGGFDASGDQMVQELSGVVGGMFSTPAYWQGTVPTVGLQNMIYTVGATDEPKMFVISNGLIQTPPVSASSAFLFAFPGASPVISANGTTGGILWAIDSSAWNSGGTAVLYAFDATNMTPLYNSNQFSADNPGPAVKFTVPTVANGSVYMGTQTQLAVFGLFPGGRGTTHADCNRDRHCHRDYFRDRYQLYDCHANGEHHSHRDGEHHSLADRFADHDRNPDDYRHADDHCHADRQRLTPHADGLSESGLRDAQCQAGLAVVLEPGCRPSGQVGKRDGDQYRWGGVSGLVAADGECRIRRDLEQLPVGDGARRLLYDRSGVGSHREGKAKRTVAVEQQRAIRSARGQAQREGRRAKDEDASEIAELRAGIGRGRELGA